MVEDPIKIVITNYPEEQTEEMEIENNRTVPEMGSRMVPFSRELYVDGADFMEEPVKKYFRLFPGNEVRFKGAYFITCNEVIKNEDGSIKELHCTYDPQTRSGSGFEGRKVNAHANAHVECVEHVTFGNVAFFRQQFEDGRNTQCALVDFRY